jgi:PiT family inorganic phosphate transporter
MSRAGRSFHTLDKDLGRITNTESAQHYAFQPVWRLGLSLLLLVAGLVLIMGVTGVSNNLVGLAAGLLVAGWLGIAIGSNDVANSLGPAVGAGAIGLVPGLILVAIAEIAGASLAGGAVTSRLANGIFEVSALPSAESAQMVMLSALMGAASWITISTGIGLPVSTSHSIVGGLAGAAMVALGFDDIHWLTLAIMAITWVAAPFLSAGLAGAVLIFLRIFVTEAEDRVAASRRWLPLLVGAMAGLFFAYLLLLAHQDLILSIGLGGAAALVAGWLMDRHLHKVLILDHEKPSTKRLFRPPLLGAAILMGFAHGANDVANVAGPLTVILTAGHDGSGPVDVPMEALLLAAFAIAAGTLFFGRRLVQMVGSGITKLNAARAFCVSLATAATVLLASSAGFPLSTTHVAIGGIFGVGFAREWLDRRAMRQREDLPPEEQRRRELIRRSHVTTISTAWIVTVPLTAALGAMFCWVVLWGTGV